MKKLDKSKPFGTVHGDDQGRCFEQNGMCFDVNGDAIVARREEPAEEEQPDAPADDGDVHDHVDKSVKPAKAKAK